jgi:hypothetical protein
VQFEAAVPTFEDKLAQRAIVTVLEAVYEQDFLPCSFGFRPGRSAHQALRSLHAAIMSHESKTALGGRYRHRKILRFPYRTPIFETFLTSESRMV